MSEGFGFRGDPAHQMLKGDDQNGAFQVPGPIGPTLRIIASNGEGWEHVSVSTQNRCPNWLEMCVAKDLFWAEDQTVIQFHPKASEYVNCHPHCSHLWRPTDFEITLPASYLIGPKQ